MLRSYLLHRVSSKRLLESVRAASGSVAAGLQHCADSSSLGDELIQILSVGAPVLDLSLQKDAEFVLSPGEPLKRQKGIHGQTPNNPSELIQFAAD